MSNKFLIKKMIRGFHVKIYGDDFAKIIVHGEEAAKTLFRYRSLRINIRHLYYPCRRKEFYIPLTTIGESSDCIESVILNYIIDTEIRFSEGILLDEALWKGWKTCLNA